MGLTAFQKFDEVKLYNKKFVLTSDPYQRDGRMVMDTNECIGTYVPYSHLISDAKILRTNIGKRIEKHINKIMDK